MIKKQGKEQIFSGSFIADADEEVFVEVLYGVNPPLWLSFKFIYGDHSNATPSMNWTTQDGIIKFTLIGFQRGLQGIGSTHLTELGSVNGKPLYMQVAYGAAAGDSRLVSVFLYVGGNNA